MPPRTGFTLADLHRHALESARRQNELQPMPPQTPDMLKATGLKFSIRVEWSQVPGVDGYRVAAMPATSQNLAAPQKLFTVTGDSSLEFTEPVGDVATQRYYSVQAFKKNIQGETYFSEWRYPLVNATSKVEGGAADSAPPNPPSAPIEPETEGDPGDPGGLPLLEVESN